MSWIADRLKEPSTWAGLAAFIAGLSFIPHAQDIAGALPDIGKGVAAVFGVVAVFLPEKAKP